MHGQTLSSAIRTSPRFPKNDPQNVADGDYAGDQADALLSRFIRSLTFQSLIERPRAYQTSGQKTISRCAGDRSFLSPFARSREDHPSGIK
jgi:hypothetical protein